MQNDSLALVGWKMAGISAIYTLAAAVIIKNSSCADPYGVGLGVVGIGLAGLSAQTFIYSWRERTVSASAGRELISPEPQ